MTTLRDNAQKEGARVLEFLERHSQRVLADHGFEPDGRAPEAVVDEITAGTDRRQKAENECSIPCYALRRRLGLPNGSSPVESANNQVTARRQKHNGMSWSKAGSHALTALSVLVCNRCQAIRVREHVVPLRFVDNKAA